MEKRVSVFIGRTIFFTSENYRISILIGYTVFLTSEENRIVILLTINMAAALGKERKGIWLLCQKGEELLQ